MTENEKQEAFDKWYDENYDEWAEGEEGFALREELEQAFKCGIEALEKENTDLLKDRNRWMQVDKEDCENWSKDKNRLTKAKELLAKWVELYKPKLEGYPITPIQEQTEQFLNSEVEK